jgi:membrane associated rhomboid family serine protease
MPIRREPAINLPPVVLWSILVLVAIEIGRAFLSVETETELLLLFAFIPARFDPGFQYATVMPGGFAADVWTFFTYALLHGGWMHLVVNCLWLAAFGSAVARRFGTVRFLLFSAVCAAAGAALHLATHWGNFVPMIGASGAISGLMAAAIRFVFQSGGPLSRFRYSDQAIYNTPALPLMQALRQGQVIAFLAVWFGLNLIFGVASSAIPGVGADQVAWQAHVGGFLAGLLLFRIFDPVSRALQ